MRPFATCLPAAATLLLVAASVLPAQGWVQRYASSAGAHTPEVALETASGEVLLAGIVSLAGEADLWVARLGADGSLSWSRRYPRLGEDSLGALVELADGTLLAAGFTEETADGSGRSQRLLWIAPDGTPLQEILYGSGGRDEALDVAILPDGDLLVAGSLRPGPIDAWSLMRLGPGGQIVWTRRFEDFIQSGRAPVVAVAADGGILVGANLGSGADDARLVRLAPDGTLAWQRILGEAGSDLVEDLAATSDGGSALLLRTRSFGVGDWDFLVLRFDPDGALLWETVLGTPGIDEIEAILELPDGRLAVAGAADLDGLQAFLALLDTAGEVVGQHVFPLPQSSLTDLALLGDGGILGAGRIEEDAALFRLDAEGLARLGCSSIEVTAFPWSRPLVPAESRVPDPDDTGPLSTEATPSAVDQPLEPLCPVIDCTTPPDEVSHVGTGDPPLRVLDRGTRVQVEADAEVGAYDLYVDRLGSWYEPAPATGTICHITAWTESGDGTAVLAAEIPAGSWILVTGSNPCGEGTSGARSDTTPREDPTDWRACGAFP